MARFVMPPIMTYRSLGTSIGATYAPLHVVCKIGDAIRDTVDDWTAQRVGREVRSEKRSTYYLLLLVRILGLPDCLLQEVCIR